MAKITNISSEQLLKIDSISSKVIKKTFGRKEDIVELHIYDVNDNLLYSENNFTDYILDEPEETSPSTPLIATTKEPRIVKPDAKGAREREDIPGPKCQKDVTILHCANPYLPWDYIVDRLEQPKRWVRRYVFGSWDNFEGLVWSDFDENTHVIKPFEIPVWWHRYVVMDHGHRNPTAALFFAVSETNDIYLYDMHYKADEWIDFHAEEIWRKVGTQEITRWLADPSIWHVRGGMSTDVTIGAQYEEYGIYFEKADNDVAAGIDRVAKYMQLDDATQKPKFYVFDKPCMDPFIEEVTDYRWEDMGGDKKNISEKPMKKNDHSMDALRYMINHIETSVRPQTKRIPPQWLQKKIKKDNWKIV